MTTRRARMIVVRKLVATDEIRASRWFKVGDHPAVVPYKSELPIERGEKCGRTGCKAPLRVHGFMWEAEDNDESPTSMLGGGVCPGDWILTQGKRRWSMSPDEFSKEYEEMP